eukprot:326190_1
MFSNFLVFILSTLTTSSTEQTFKSSLGLDNGAGLTPPMGWNSWNHYECNVSADVVMQTMKAFISTGLRDAGYIYINLDDCWQLNRTSNGSIVADYRTFPNGIQPLVQYAHNNKMKFGLYSDTGPLTCQQRPGSKGHEQQDANTYAAWKIDYLKYDNCFNDKVPPNQSYPIMTKALNNTGRSIFFSMADYGVYRNCPNVVNMWRVNYDIQDWWSSMIANWDSAQAPEFAGPGGWNNPDMLEVGNGGMTQTEYITHFSLWCIGKSPLLIGCDVTNMSDDTKTIFLNHEAISVNQDHLGVQASMVYNSSNGQQQIYSGPLMKHCLAVLFLNRNGNQNAQITVKWSQIGVNENQNYVIRDLWKHQNVTTTKQQYTATVAPHGVKFFKFFPSN